MKSVVDRAAEVRYHSTRWPSLLVLALQYRKRDPRPDHDGVDRTVECARVARDRLREVCFESRDPREIAEAVVARPEALEAVRICLKFGAVDLLEDVGLVAARFLNALEARQKEVRWSVHNTDAKAWLFAGLLRDDDERDIRHRLRIAARLVDWSERDLPTFRGHPQGRRIALSLAFHAFDPQLFEIAWNDPLLRAAGEADRALALDVIRGAGDFSAVSMPVDREAAVVSMRRFVHARVEAWDAEHENALRQGICWSTWFGKALTLEFLADEAKGRGIAFEPKSLTPFWGLLNEPGAAARVPFDDPILRAYARLATSDPLPKCIWKSRENSNWSDATISVFALGVLSTGDEAYLAEVLAWCRAGGIERPFRLPERKDDRPVVLPSLARQTVPKLERALSAEEFASLAETYRQFAGLYPWQRQETPDDRETKGWLIHWDFRKAFDERDPQEDGKVFNSRLTPPIVAICWWVLPNEVEHLTTNIAHLLRVGDVWDMDTVRRLYRGLFFSGVEAHVAALESIREAIKHGDIPKEQIDDIARTTLEDLVSAPPPPVASLRVAGIGGYCTAVRSAIAGGLFGFRGPSKTTDALLRHVECLVEHRGLGADIAGDLCLASFVAVFASYETFRRFTDAMIQPMDLARRVLNPEAHGHPWISDFCRRSLIVPTAFAKCLLGHAEGGWYPGWTASDWRDLGRKVRWVEKMVRLDDWGFPCKTNPKSAVAHALRWNDALEAFLEEAGVSPKPAGFFELALRHARRSGSDAATRDLIVACERFFDPEKHAPALDADSNLRLFLHPRVRKIPLEAYLECKRTKSGSFERMSPELVDWIRDRLIRLHPDREADVRRAFAAAAPSDA